MGIIKKVHDCIVLYYGLGKFGFNTTNTRWTIWDKPTRTKFCPYDPGFETCFGLINHIVLFFLHRSLIYSSLIRGNTPVPQEIFISATIFTTINGFMHSRQHTKISVLSEEWIYDPRFIIGEYTVRFMTGVLQVDCVPVHGFFVIDEGWSCMLYIFIS